ncbi:MAG: 2-oxoacid:acceptor oxidoreductase family protein [Candidatus Helarchaeota archaeon]
MRNEILIAGFGGQGVITLAKIIAAAAILEERKYATQAEAYGPASRGGSCWAEVVVDDKDPIDYPRAINPNIFILLSELAAGKYKRAASKPGKVTITDPLTVKKLKIRKGKKIEIDAQRIAQEKFGMGVVSNMILFGAFIGLFPDIISEEAGRKTVEKFVPPKALSTNLEAFDLGLKLAKEQAASAQ